MIILLLVTALAALGIGATLFEVARDGYRPIPADPRRVTHRG